MRQAGTGRTALATIALASAVVVCVVVALDLAPLLRGPAPYPPEWQWSHRPLGAPGSSIPALTVLALLVCAQVASASRQAQARPRVAAGILLVAGTGLAFSFHLAVLAREEGGALRSLIARTASPTITSYHSVAVSETTTFPREFVRCHATLLPSLALEAKHAATHPPGLVLWYRASLSLATRSPGLVAPLLDRVGGPRKEGEAARRRAERGAERGAALLGSLGLAAVGSLAIPAIVLMGLTLGLGPLPATRVAVLFGVLPGPALMAPAVDAATGGLVAGASACLALAFAHRSPSHRALLAVAAGISGGLALWASYGSALFLAVGGGAIAAAFLGRRTSWTSVLALSTVAASMAAIVSVGIPWLLGGSPVEAALTALEIHRTLFTETRSYWLWLAYNPVDFAMLMGVPVALVAAFFSALAVGRLGAHGWTALDSIERYRVALLAGWLLLLVSGVTRGEVGRLWIPLMPFVLLATAKSAGSNPSRWEATLHTLSLGALTLTLGAYWTL